MDETMSPDEELRQSIINRHNFLNKKVNEWNSCDSESKKKDLIVELIQLEPSHLGEKWILDQVIKWMKDREKNIDYLNAAFIARGQRDELTERQRENLSKACFLDHKIKKIAETGKLTKIDATRAWVYNSEDDTLADEAETAILQRIKRYKKSIDNRALPYPYYGKDVLIVDMGNENQRVEFSIQDKKIEIDGHALFGNTIITVPWNERFSQVIPIVA